MLISFCLVVSSNVFAQAKEISFEESHQQLVTAFGKEYQGKSRINLRYEYFNNGKLSSKSETVTESDVIADRLRLIRTETSDGRIERFELIRVKETFYCRKNNTAWKKSDDWCDNQGFNSGATGEEQSSKYTIEETKLNNQSAKLYRQYIVKTDGQSETYWDYKFWVSEDGFILRREIEEGLIKPKKISSRMTETREYSAKNIKIEAPIK